ncbi:MAG TPA: NAD(P)/FAD-dependent oxidoreductase [Spirochaetota bacterium]|nr:NAD(P)/FAD-dependent oxidoreductase [Spirochaetota bacterium]HPV39668.1 NAD(P)/FAD-dependent oxidoreductase [Spirochaetota bacterium]
MERTECAIIGRGPAGLSAAIYSARAGLSTLVLGSDPKVAGDYGIDNYFGFPETITGKELIARGEAQARKFGASLAEERALGIHPGDRETFVVRTDRREITACAVILATGVERRRPAIRNLDDYEGRGVSYCVSCDGYFFRNRRIMVVGEGNYAANQAVELLHYSPTVSICTMGKPVAINPEFMDRIARAGIPFIDSPIVMLKGDGRLTHVSLATGEERETDGLFIAIGDASSVDFARSLGIFTSGNFIQVDETQKTNVPGIFAAGDCTGGFLQISVAVGEGAVAARSAIEHVKKICRG